jgi:hypothetical protein
MTNFSSLDMPFARADVVAAIVDILDRSPESLMQSLSHAPDLAGLIHGGLLYGNIAVKPPPIRLSAFATGLESRASVPTGPVGKQGRDVYCDAQGRQLTALLQGVIACLHAISHQGRIKFPKDFLWKFPWQATVRRSRAHTGNK